MRTKDILMYVLGGTIVIGFFSLLALLVYKGAPSENTELLHITIGSLLSAFATVVGYFYGSSKGSSEKNDIIKKSE